MKVSQVSEIVKELIGKYEEMHKSGEAPAAGGFTEYPRVLAIALEGISN